MSIEKDLLVRAKVLIECLDTSILQDQADIILSEIKELLAQPEPEQSSKWWYGKGVEDTKYFLKREPLSDKEITKNTPKLIHIGERLAFHAGVRFSERYHNIGGGE